jgi:hypothetical protein
MDTKFYLTIAAVVAILYALALSKSFSSTVKSYQCFIFG